MYRSCPSTGKELKVGDITRSLSRTFTPASMWFMMDEYFKDGSMDTLKGLDQPLPRTRSGTRQQLRREAEKRGPDLMFWLRQTSSVASERIGGERLTYVSNMTSTTSRTACSARSWTDAPRRGGGGRCSSRVLVR